MKYRLRTLMIVITVFCVFFGYLRLYMVYSFFSTDPSGLASFRAFDTEWQVFFFKPAAALESIVRRRSVHAIESDGKRIVAPGWSTGRPSNILRDVSPMRFTIRDLLWLMVVVAMGCGWWVARNEAAKARLEAASYERSAKIWRGNTISFAKTAKEYAGFTMQVIDENGHRIDPISGKVLTSAEYK